MGKFKPPLVLDVLGREFTLIETSAPASYDYNGLTIMGDKTPEKGDTRFALIPSDMVQDQLQRYQSGMYSAELAERDEPWTVAAVRDSLWMALREQLGTL